MERHCSVVYSSAGTEEAIPEFTTTMSRRPKSDLIVLIVDSISDCEETFALYARQSILFVLPISDAMDSAVEDVL